jgi:AraC family transcriptional regulator, positive regulator of tynA and feaB
VSYSTWASRDVESRRRFEYYRSALCASFVRLSPELIERASDFDATLRLWQSGGREFVLLTASSHNVLRRPRDVSQAGDDHFYVNYVVAGEHRIDQGDDLIRTRAGELVVVDNAQPFAVELRADRSHRLLTYKMQRKRLSCAAGEASRRLASHALSPVLRRVLAHAAMGGASWDGDDLEGSAEAIDGLIRIILAARGDETNSSRPRTTLARTKAFLAANCSNAFLTIDDIAHDLGLSRRTLQEHLNICGTSFSAQLMHLRADEAYRLLQSAPERSVEDISFACGFRDATTFYRAFRRRYGATPAVARGSTF